MPYSDAFLGRVRSWHFRGTAVLGIEVGTKPLPDNPSGPRGWDRITPKGGRRSEY
jgi:hypothetical protein